MSTVKNTVSEKTMDIIEEEIKEEIIKEENFLPPHASGIEEEETKRYLGWEIRSHITLSYIILILYNFFDFRKSFFLSYY